MKGQILWNQDKGKYELYGNGKVLARSRSLEHLSYLVTKKKSKAVVDAGGTDVEVVSTQPKEIQILDQADQPLVAVATAPEFNINERFEFMEDLIGMVVAGSAKSILISGEGGVGKTFTVLESLKSFGKIDCLTVQPTVESLIGIEDSEETIEAKALAQIEAQQGDYLIVKGHSSAKSLYRLLFENRNRILIFDDCDSVLRDGTAIDLLKAALDSYEDRWVSWKIDSDMDLPSCFKFNGSIIFISNRPLAMIDEAVRTRCFKVDLSMTKLQRIERMRAVLHNVLPEVEMEHKVEAIELLEENLHLTNDINFRSLMNIILIRTSAPAEKWKRLATYSLTEQ